MFISTTNNDTLYSHRKEHWRFWETILVTPVVLILFSFVITWIVREFLFSKLGYNACLILYELPFAIIIGWTIGTVVKTKPFFTTCIVGCIVGGIAIAFRVLIDIRSVSIHWLPGVLEFWGILYFPALLAGIYLEKHNRRFLKVLLIISFAPGLLLSSFNIWDVEQPILRIYNKDFHFILSHLSRKYDHNLLKSGKGMVFFDYSEWLFHDSFHETVQKSLPSLMLEYVEQYLIHEGMFGWFDPEVYGAGFEVIEIVPGQKLRFAVTSSPRYSQRLSEEYKLQRLSEHESQITVICHIHGQFRAFRQNHLEEALLQVLGDELENNTMWINYSNSKIKVQLRSAIQMLKPFVLGE